MDTVWDSARSTPAPYGAVCECFLDGFWWACVVEALDARLSPEGASLRPAAAALLARVPEGGAGRKRGRSSNDPPVYRVRALAAFPAAPPEASTRAGFPPPLAAGAVLRDAAGSGDTCTLLPHTQLRPLG